MFSLTITHGPNNSPDHMSEILVGFGIEEISRHRFIGYALTLKLFHIYILLITYLN